MATGEAIAGVRAGVAASVATDEEILGIDTRPGSPNGGAATAPGGDAAATGARGNGTAAAEMLDAAVNPSAAKDAPAGKESGARKASEQQAQAVTVEPPELKAIFDANPELRRAWRDEKAFREIFPTVEAAREMQKIFPTVEDARAAGQQLAELAQLDALFFSNRPEAHAELARFVRHINPQAFRGLARAMAQMQEESAPPGVGPAQDPRRDTEEAKDAAPRGDAAQDERRSQADADASKRAVSEQDAARQNAFAAFYQEANAGAVQGVIDAIQTQVERLLPEGVAAGARNRVIGEIYRELDASLRGNRALAQQVRQAFRSGNLDAQHQRAVVGLIVGRARQALPAVAKKVIGEWTTGVLAASSAKFARQRAAESRVDLTGGGAPGAASRRPLTPTDIDYAKLSDADILNL